ncbi:MAG: glycosyltransferase family 4 protein [Candidatus Zixiibacteriota bacterium]|nr:MAG: glycosyltransferase family 4 protein [candidate division Zixibacteria bacterium]
MPAIAIDVRMLHSAGVGTYLCGLLPLIISRRSDIIFHLLGDTGSMHDFQWTRAENVRRLDCHAPIYSIAEQFELVRRLPACDLFFSPHYNVPLLYRGRMIATIHDIFHLARENSDKTLPRIIYARAMLSAALRKSRIVMTDSQFTLDEMRKYRLPHPDKVRIVSLGPGSAYNGGGAAVKKPGAQYFLYVGNVKPHKNLRRLISAYKLLHAEGRVGIPLMLVGEEKKFITGMPELKDEILHSSWRNWIKITGRVSNEELKHCYSQAAALVLPSLYEGFGLPPLEAMALGCPCLVSRVASLPEVCGKAAHYCDPYDVADIADKMHQILVDNRLRAELIERGYQQVQKYSWRKTAEAVLDVMEEVLTK